MADDEVPRIHEGIDYSSRDPKGKPTPLEFKAGVFGKVVFARPGIIVVEVDDRGTRVEYLHNSTVADGIEQGKEVTPSTILGKTGNYSPSLNKARQPYKLSGAPIHLHVQAMTKSGQALYPDEVLRFARTEPALRRQPVFFVPMKWVDLKQVKPFSWDEVKEGFEVREEPAGATRVRIIYDDDAPKRK